MVSERPGDSQGAKSKADNLLEDGVSATAGAAFADQKKLFVKLRHRYPPYWRALRRRNALLLIGSGFVLYMHGAVSFCWVLALCILSRATAAAPFPRLSAFLICAVLFAVRDYPEIEQYLRDSRAAADSGFLNFPEVILRTIARLTLTLCEPAALIFRTANHMLVNATPVGIFAKIPHLSGVYAVPSVIRFLVIKVLSFSFDSATAYSAGDSLRERAGGRDAFLLAKLRILGAQRRARINSSSSSNSESETRMGGSPSETRSRIMGASPHEDQENYVMLSSSSEGVRKRLGKAGPVHGPVETPEAVDDATVVLDLLEELTEKPDFALYDLQPSLRLSEDPKRNWEKEKRREEQTLLLKLLLPRWELFCTRMLYRLARRGDVFVVVMLVCREACSNRNTLSFLGSMCVEVFDRLDGCCAPEKWCGADVNVHGFNLKESMKPFGALFGDQREHQTVFDALLGELPFGETGSP